jgi:hypothetical protein
VRVRQGGAVISAAAVVASVLVGLVAPQAATADDSASWTGTLIAGSLAPAAVVTDSAGDVYVAGKYDAQVHKLSAAGTPIAGFSTIGEGLSQISALAISGGSVYVAERVGGGLGTGTVVKLNATTGAVQTQFNAAVANLATPLGLAVSGSGVWVTTEDSRAIVTLSPTDGSVKSGFSFDSTTNAIDPVSLAIDSTGDLYVANAACSTAASPVVKVNSSTGAAIPAFNAISGNIGLGDGVALDSDGTVLVATGTCSGPSGTVDKLDPTTGTVTGHLLQGGYVGLATGPGDAAYLFSSTLPTIMRYDVSTDTVDSSFSTSAEPLGLPAAVAVDQSGQVYVADSLTSGIDKFDGVNGAQQSFANTHDTVTPNAVTTYGNKVYLAGSPNNEVIELKNDGSAAGASLASNLTNPARIAVADASHLFETVTDTPKIVERNPTDNSTYSGFSVTADGLSYVAGIAADNAGHLFVTETCPTNAIVELDASTGAVLKTITAASAGDITCPRSVATDNAGHVFVVGLNGSYAAEVVELSTSDGSVVSSFDAQSVAGGLNVGSSLAVTSDDQVFLTGPAGLVRVDPTAAVAPAAPTISSVIPGETSATASWTPSGDGGNAITGYTATAQPGGAHCVAAAPSTSCAISGLAANSTYSITVTATNSVGTSAASEPASVTTSHYKLSLTPNGEGSIISPSGINCPNSGCSPVYASGTSVTLSAFGDPGSYFAGWTGACSGTNSCTVAMSQPRAVGATFTKGTTHNLAFFYDTPSQGTGSGTLTINGESCDVFCNAFGLSFKAGSTITVVPSPNSGSYFAGWSGGPCAGSTSTCTFALSGDTQMAALFTAGTVPKPVPVTVVTKGSGTGTVTGPGISCPSTCSNSYAAGTSVALVSTPAHNSTFEGWTGACTGRAACTIAPSAAMTVTATFQKIPAPNTKLVATSIHGAKRTATFTFSRTGEATGYQCAITRLGATVRYHSCGSPVTYRNLAKGHYRFRVRAVGPGGTDLTPASRRFTI